MNAIKFIKEHGVEKARELLARLHKLGCPDDMQITVINGMWHRTANGFTYPDLNRLVESVDLIGKYHSIDHAKNHYNNMREALNQYQYENKDIEDLSNELKQAIADYEAIYGGEHV